VLKTATGGYDGKGQRVIHSESDSGEAFSTLAGDGRELILEEWIHFRMEASVICARGVDGAVQSFPVGENVHHRGILDFTIVPARLPETVLREAIAVGETLASGLDVVGLLAVELFIDQDNRVLVNEIAPRPHNSGHYTWEACSVSQFEQQLRAVCGLPLARPTLRAPAAMANLLGEHISTERGLAGLAEVLHTPALSLHLYGKREARPGRKMGHLTVLAGDAETAYRRVARARRVLAGEIAL
jgi:5-(carboxyamino)imidazole ribonucleotide synthase